MHLENEKYSPFPNYLCTLCDQANDLYCKKMIENTVMSIIITKSKIGGGGKRKKRGGGTKLEKVVNWYN